MPTSAVVAFADQRSAEILAAVRRTFVEKGFDGASMQDLARETGMSVGNFYRYFPSKDAIVSALIARDMEEMERDFAAILTAPHPIEALRQTIRAHVRLEHCLDDGRLWAEISAAAQRKPAIGKISAQMEAAIETNLTMIFAHATGLPPEAARKRYAAQAQLLVLLVKGINMHCAIPRADGGHLTDLVLRIVDQILDEVVADRPSAPVPDAPKG